MIDGGGVGGTKAVDGRRCLPPQVTGGKMGGRMGGMMGGVMGGMIGPQAHHQELPGQALHKGRGSLRPLAQPSIGPGSNN